MPPHAPSLSHRGPGSFDTFTQQRPTSQAGTAHCRPVLARLRRPPHQLPFACADGAGRPASPMGIPSPSHFAPPAFDTSVEHPTIHPSIPVSTRRSLPRLLRPPPHDQIGMSRRPTRPQPRRWLFCAVPLLPEVAHHPLPTLRHRFAPPRTPGPRSSPATRRCARSPNPDPRPSAQPQTTHRCSSPHATARGVVIPPHTTPQARRSTFSLQNVLNALPARRLDLAASRPPPHRSSGFARRARPPARPSPAQRT